MNDRLLNVFFFMILYALSYQQLTDISVISKRQWYILANKTTHKMDFKILVLSVVGLASSLHTNETFKL